MANYHSVALDETAVLIKAGKTEVFNIEASNITATQDLFLQMFDAAAAGDVTVGTTTPNLSLLIPSGDGTDRGAMDKAYVNPVEFSSGLVVAVTTGPQTAGSPTNSPTVNIDYR